MISLGGSCRTIDGWRLRNNSGYLRRGLILASSCGLSSIVSVFFTDLRHKFYCKYCQNYTVGGIDAGDNRTELIVMNW